MGGFGWVFDSGFNGFYGGFDGVSMVSIVVFIRFNSVRVVGLMICNGVW